MQTTRRQFLSGSIGVGAALPLLRGLAPARPAARKQKILILGGTAFLGPAIVEAALARGHELTLFNRGRTNPHLFPDLEKIRGNRRRPIQDGQPEQDLSALRGRTWDSVVDTSGYFTVNVEDTAKLLADAVDQYLFVASISVYAQLGKSRLDLTEDSRLGTLNNKYTSTIDENTFGPLKAYCEKAVEAELPGRATHVRPGYIVGPRDRSDRFTYWPMRFARGGEILAPGDRDAELQLIDVRDLGEWIVHLLEQRTYGPFNAVGYKGRVSTQEFLHTGKGTLNHDCSFTWVDDAFLEEHGVTSWGEMPAWTPASTLNHCDNQQAILHGLTFRPIAETIRDTRDWAVAERPKDRRWAAGMKPEREAELLEEWRARHK